MAEIGLNQILQNEFISRGTSRGNLGLGLTLCIPLRAPEKCLRRLPQQPGLEIELRSSVRQCAYERAHGAQAQRKADGECEESNNPTQNLKEEVWEVQAAFPRTVKEIKQLRFSS